MKTILEKLHNDHINFSKLLRFLEKQLGHLKNCDTAELELILIAIRYMKEYPDHIHHPIENVVFHYFMENYPEAHDSISHLLDDHEHMPLLTEKLFEMVQYALMDVPQPRDELCNYLELYIKKQKEHMDTEEVAVYPVLKSNMQKKDWDQIDSDLTKIDDPLFGRLIKESYKPLFDYVSRAD